MFIASQTQMKIRPNCADDEPVDHGLFIDPNYAWRIARTPTVDCAKFSRRRRALSEWSTCSRR